MATSNISSFTAEILPKLDVKYLMTLNLLKSNGHILLFATELFKCNPDIAHFLHNGIPPEGVRAALICSKRLYKL